MHDDVVCLPQDVFGVFLAVFFCIDLRSDHSIGVTAIHRLSFSPGSKSPTKSCAAAHCSHCPNMLWDKEKTQQLQVQPLVKQKKITVKSSQVVAPGP
jgi:hypothetical protein